MAALLIVLALACSTTVLGFQGSTSNALTRSVQRQHQQRTYSTINEWIVEQGSKKNDIKVEIGIDSTLALNDLKKGDALLTIPLGLALSAAKAEAYFGKSSIDVEKLRTGDVGMIALLLLVEKNMGESSKYYEYIKRLPEEVPGVLSWSDSEIAKLSRSTTRKVMGQINSVATVLLSSSTQCNSSSSSSDSCIGRCNIGLSFSE
jgi:hypothetical protein